MLPLSIRHGTRQILLCFRLLLGCYLVHVSQILQAIVLVQEWFQNINYFLD